MVINIPRNGNASMVLSHNSYHLMQLLGAYYAKDPHLTFTSAQTRGFQVHSNRWTKLTFSQNDI
jgi:hypothetical protein